MRPLPNNYLDTLFAHGMPSIPETYDNSLGQYSRSNAHLSLLPEWLESLHPLVYDRAPAVAQVLRGKLSEFRHDDIIKMIFRIVFNAERPDHCVTSLFNEAKSEDNDVFIQSLETEAQLYMRVVSAMGLHKKPSKKK